MGALLNELLRGIVNDSDANRFWTRLTLLYLTPSEQVTALAGTGVDPGPLHPDGTQRDTRLHGVSEP